MEGLSHFLNTPAPVAPFCPGHLVSVASLPFSLCRSALIEHVVPMALSESIPCLFPLLPYCCPLLATIQAQLDKRISGDWTPQQPGGVKAPTGAQTAPWLRDPVAK